MPTHGTRACYVAGCRRPECRAANRAYNNHRNRMAAYGRPTTNLVDATPVREHVQALTAAGMGTRAIAEAAGVSRNTLRALLNGRGHRPPTRRLHPDTAEAILAVRPVPAAHALVDAAGTRRRVQALIVLGWSQAKLATRLGMKPTNFGDLLTSQQVTAATARAVAALYDQLWHVAPPEDTHRDRIAASRARRYAADRGWLPPMAWDDELLDLPDAELEAELERRARAMEDREVRAAQKAYARGDRSPLIVAATREHYRRKAAQRRQRQAAA